MLNSKSTASKSRFWLLLVVALTVLGVATRHAHADRKRVVVLPFDGDEKAEKFHAADTSKAVTVSLRPRIAPKGGIAPATTFSDVASA